MVSGQANVIGRGMQIGVAMPIGELPTRKTPSYPEIRELAQQAETSGFDSIWVFDHLLFRAPEEPTVGIWEAWTMLVALAEATERVALGTFVLCTAFRNPAILAKMIATADEVSGGRLIAGLGAGWHKPEFDAFGIPFDHRVDRFEEALHIIVPLLRDGQVDFHGSYYQAENCELRPRGPRSHVPILIGAFGPRMLRLTAEYADSWNTCWLGQPTLLGERRAALEAACVDVGRDPQSLAVTVGVSVTYPAATASDETPPDPAKTLTGSPEEIAAGLRAYADLGVAHLICSLNSTTSESLAWFTEAVNIYRERS